MKAPQPQVARAAAAFLQTSAAETLFKALREEYVERIMGTAPDQQTDRERFYIAAGMVSELEQTLQNWARETK